MATKAPNDKADRKDIWYPYFSQLRVDKKKNVREDYGNIKELADQIREPGVKVSLRGWRKDGLYHVTDGFRRYDALELLYKEDGIDRQVPFLLEPQGYKDDERLADMMSLGVGGKQLTPYEFAKGCLQLKVEYSWSETQIAKRYSVTQAYVNRLCKLEHFKPQLVELVKKGTVKMADAINLIVDKKQDEFFARLAKGEFGEPSILEAGLAGGDSAGPGKEQTGPSKPPKISGKAIRPPKGSQASGKADESAAPALNSWALVKKVITGYKGKPQDPAAAKALLFLGKVINNELTEDEIKKWFK